MDNTNSENKPNVNEKSTNVLEDVEDKNQMITIGDFLKMKIKLGKIVAAEKMPGMKKILKITVDIGEKEKREIGAGIALFYTPEDLVGKTVVVLTNLQPRKLGDILSNGMVLAADGPEGRPLLLTVDEQEYVPGSEIH